MENRGLGQVGEIILKYCFTTQGAATSVLLLFLLTSCEPPVSSSSVSTPAPVPKNTATSTTLPEGPNYPGGSDTNSPFKGMLVTFPSGVNMREEDVLELGRIRNIISKINQGYEKKTLGCAEDEFQLLCAFIEKRILANSKGDSVLEKALLAKILYESIKGSP